MTKNADVKKKGNPDNFKYFYLQFWSTGVVLAKNI
jgi:hypothetical protein